MIKPILRTIDSFLAQVIVFLIRGYQKTISPDKGLLSFWLKGKVCSHYPHCSEYGARALKRYHFFEGMPLVIDRVLHCFPSMHKIYDPEFYKVVFVSSAQIGVPFLEALHADKRFEVV